MKRKRILLVLILFFLFPLPAFAQQLSLSFSPPLLEAMIQPGKSITSAYQISNKGSLPLYLKTAIVPFRANPETGQIEYQKNPPLASLPQFSLDNADLELGEAFLLPPGGSEQLVLKISFPQDLPEKDYYYTFFVEQSAQEHFFDQNQTFSLAKVGSHLLLTSSQDGAPDLRGSISQFKPVPKIADLFDSVELKIKAANTGESLFKSKGKIEIFDWLGRKRATLNLRPDNVLTNSQRELVCFETEEEKVIATPCRFFSFFPGPYRAVATIELNGSERISRTASFYLLPLKTGAGLIICLLIIWLFREISSKKERNI